MQNQTNGVNQPQVTTLGQDLWALTRYWLRGRRGPLIIGGGVALGGVVFGWSWLVAAGIAPILLGVLPCVAMCALGLCMNRTGEKSCSSDTRDDIKDDMKDDMKDDKALQSSDDQ